MTTTLLDASIDLEEPGLDAPSGPINRPPADDSGGGGGEGGGDETAETEISTVTVTLVAVSAVLSGFGAAWMVGGMFRGQEARLIAFLGVLLGGGMNFAATRWRAAFLNYIVLPLALLLGAVLMAGSSGSGTSSLPALVKDAVTSSQVLQPPIDFAPGWRLILVVVLSLFTAAAASLALSLRRTRLAVGVPVPLTIAAALVQPPGSAVATGAVAVGFVVMALSTSYVADGVGDSFDPGFEMRRLARSAFSGVLLIAVLLAASKVHFLFPDSHQHHVIPPRKPPVSPPPKDVPLYDVKGTLPGPLRLGVIDVYDPKQQAWLLPPVDDSRLMRLSLPANLPDSGSAGAVGNGATTPRGATYSVTVKVDQATGHLLPDLAGTTRVGGGTTVEYDPRTQTLALANRPVYTGLTYTLTAGSQPTGAQLSASTGAVPDALKPYLEAPPVPASVAALIGKAPKGAYARLEYLRAALYAHFVAAGEGTPTDVSAARVAQLLAGGKGNPYELTASEALLARWAGIPARMGYGYYGGTTLPDGATQFRPTDAVTYLEVWFSPYGWVPIVGVPPHAEASLDQNQQHSNPNIQVSPDLGLQVYLAVRQPPYIPLYTYFRYYAERVFPVAGGALLLWLLYPVALKVVRRRRRARWAAAHGPAGQIAVAYCQLRDLLIDLALPAAGRTPLELAELVEEDEEHAELAWLVTRGLWGDLRHSLGDDDARVARELAASVGARVAKAQPETARLLAAISRASLRTPWSREVPNAWWQVRLPRTSLSPARLWRSVRRVRPDFAAAALLLVGVVLLNGCTGPQSSSRSVAATVPFPTRLAPAEFAGLDVHAEPKAAAVFTRGAKNPSVIVSYGQVLSFSRDGLIQAALQVAQFKAGIRASDPHVVHAIKASIQQSAPVIALRPQDGHILYSSIQGSQRLYLWFPTTQSMALLVVRAQITQGASEALARGLIDYGDAKPVDETALAAAFATIPGVGPSATPVGAPSPGPGPSSIPNTTSATNPPKPTEGRP